MSSVRLVYVQDERYAAGAGMRRSGFFQVGTVFVDERYIAIEHMDVRRDCVSFAQRKAG